MEFFFCYVWRRANTVENKSPTAKQLQQHITQLNVMAGSSGSASGADGESKTPQHTIETSFLSLSRVIEAETDCTVATMDVMERINWNATNKYSRLAAACQGLDTDREYLAQLSMPFETTF